MHKSVTIFTKDIELAAMLREKLHEAGVDEVGIFFTEEAANLPAIVKTEDIIAVDSRFLRTADESVDFAKQIRNMMFAGPLIALLPRADEPDEAAFRAADCDFVISGLPRCYPRKEGTASPCHTHMSGELAAIVSCLGRGQPTRYLH